MEIDIYFDLVCPWCYIGKHRLERALANRPDLQPRICWRPFQLNPGMPRGGMDRGAYLATKFGGPERARQIHAMITDTAARDGLPLNLDRITRTPNTLDGHRLVRWVAARGSDAGAAVEAIFRAYFADGLDIGDVDVLIGIAVSLGYGADEIRSHLTSDAEIAAILSSDAAARRMGIQAVPCFVFAGRYALSGAQEPHAFDPMFDLAETGPGPALADRSS